MAPRRTTPRRVKRAVALRGYAVAACGRSSRYTTCSSPLKWTRAGSGVIPILAATSVAYPFPPERPVQQPDTDTTMLLHTLRMELPPQPPPRITAPHSSASAAMPGAR